MELLEAYPVWGQADVEGSITLEALFEKQDRVALSP